MRENSSTAPKPPGSHPGSRLLAAWVRLVQGSALSVLVLALLLTVGAAQLTITRIGINTNTTDMLSEELPFRRYDRALSQAFPQFSDNLIVVVEAATPDLADDGARRLAAALAARPALFQEVFYPEGTTFFRRNGLLYLEPGELAALGDRLAEVQPLLAALAADPSLRGLAGVLRQALREEGDPGASAALDSALGRALDSFSETAEALAAERDGGAPAWPLSWQTLLSGETPEPADKRRFIIVRPVLDFSSLEPASAAISGLRALAVELGLTASRGLRVRLTGSAVMFQDELHSLRDGMGLVGLISAVLVVGLLVLGLRSVRLVAATLVTLVAGLIWTAGFATLAIGELNLISVAFAVLFIGLSVDFGIHFSLRYREAVEAGGGTGAGPAKGGETALVEAARGVGGALSLCAAAAAIGFFSFLPTAYRGVSELGLIAGAGMFIALFANLTVLPAILSLAPLKPRGPRSPLGPRSSLGGGLQRLVSGHPRRVIGGALALGLAAAALLPFARFDDDPLNLRDPAAESMTTLFELFDDPRVTPYAAAVLAPSLEAGTALAARLAALPEVASARAISDLVPTDQDDKLAMIDEMAVFLGPLFLGAAAQGRGQGGVQPALSPEERWAALDGLREALGETEGARPPAARRLADVLDRLAEDGGGWNPAMLMRLEDLWLAGLPGRLEALGTALEADNVTLDDLPAGLRARYLAADGRARIEVLPAEDLRVPAARARFVDAVRAIAPEVTGAPVTLTEAGRAVIRAFGEAAAYALILIAVLLLVLLRSAWDSLMVLAPLVLAALLTVAATVVFDIPFNFANVIVLPLLFGLGVASGIHMVLRAREAGTGGAAGLLATSTPRAVLFSALTTIGSFAALALSSHRGTASMGILLTIAITLTMLCTLIVLPALLTRQSAPPAAPGRRGPGIARLLILFAGIGLLAFVASRIDLTEVWARVVELGPLGALAAAAVYFVAFLIDTASWQLALPSVRLNGAWLYRLWKVRMVGEALNLVIPAGSLGGEPVKAVLLKRGYGIGYREGAASLFIARTVNIVALVAFAAVGFVLMLGVEALPRSFVLAAGLGLLALGLGVAGFYAVQRWGAASFLVRRLVAWRRLGGRLAGRLEGFLEHIHAVDDRFEQFYLRQRLRFAAALALAFLNWLVGVAEIMVIMWFLGAPVSASEAWLIEAVAQLVRAGFFFVPASLGVTEAAMVLVYDALTGRPSLGFAVALIRRARELVWIAWGLWLGWLEAPGTLGGAPDRAEGS